MDPLDFVVSVQELLTQTGLKLLFEAELRRFQGKVIFENLAVLGRHFLEEPLEHLHVT